MPNLILYKYLSIGQLVFDLNLVTHVLHILCPLAHCAIFWQFLKLLHMSHITNVFHSNEPISSTKLPLLLWWKCFHCFVCFQTEFRNCFCVGTIWVWQGKKCLEKDGICKSKQDNSGYLLSVSMTIFEYRQIQNC